jgi:nucleotide-binding universal stress UspA family protein
MTVQSLRRVPANYRSSGVTSSLPPPAVARGRDATIPFSRATKGRGPVTKHVRDVLVPLDGTRHAEHALPWALRIADQTGAQIRLVYVHRPMDGPAHRRRTQLYVDFDDLLREPMEQYLSALTRRMARASSASIAPLWLDGRKIGEALAAMAQSSDLVVMATRRRGILSRLLLGSVSNQVSRRMSTPTLLVRGYRSPVDLTGRPPLRRALVPLDGSKGSEQILKPLAKLASDPSSEQILLRVTNDDRMCDTWEASTYSDWSEFGNGPLAQVEEVAGKWKKVFPNARPSVLWSDASAAKSIAQQAKELDADFIALATRPRSLLRRLIKPGVFGHLLRQGEWPLLVVEQNQTETQLHQ